MSEAIDKARTAIEDRLHEIRDEEKRLVNALKALGGRAKKTAHLDGGSKKPRRSRKRAKPGEREKQLLASIKKHPDFKQAEHAKAMGVSSNQVYGLVNKMTKAGTIKKSKEGTLIIA